MAFKCSTSSLAEETPVAKPDGSPTVAKVQKFFADIESRAGVVSTAQKVHANLAREYALLSTAVAHIPLLVGHNSLESLLAKTLGVRSWLWQAAEGTFTKAGMTQASLIDRANSAAQLLEYAAVTKALPDIRKLYNELQKSLPAVDKVQLQTILHDHIVIGQMPKLINIYDSPIVRAQLETRYQLHVQKLERLGVSPQSIQVLDETAGAISEALDTARVLAGEAGMDIRVLQNGGYFPIQAQEELRKLLEKSSETALSSASKVVFDAVGTLNDSRLSSLPAVLSLSKAADELGISELELAFRIGEPGGVSKLLRDKFSADDLKRMYDNGTLFQLPALSDELTSFFNEGFDLSLANLGEALVLDPVRAVTTYNNQLKRAIRNSSMIKTVLTEGAANGWVYDSAELAASGLPAKDFVKFGSNTLLAEMIASNNLRDEVADLWLHRTAYDQLSSQLSMSTSFSQLGLVGSALQAFMKWTGAFKRGAIVATGGVGYIQRVFLQNAVSLNAATGMQGLGSYALGLADVARTFKNKSLDHLPTKTFANLGGQEYSLRDLYELTFFKRGSTFVSGAGETLDQVDARNFMDVWSKESWQRFFKYQEIYHQRYGSPVTGKIGGVADVLREFGDRSFRQAYDGLAKANQASDFAARWTAVRTLANNPRLAKRQQWDSLQQLLEYTNEYFSIQENVGSVGRLVGQLGVPFAGFAMVAPGSALRHVIRNPWQYGRMMLLYSQANRNIQLTDAELSEYDKSSYPLFLSRDESNGKLQAINPGTVDFYLDTSTWMLNNFGLRDSTQKQMERQINPASQVTDMLADLATRTYVGKGVLAAMGIDPTTLENYGDSPQQDTLLGIPMSRPVRTALVSIAPILRSLDRNLPEQLVGRPEKYDSTGLRMIDPGVPSASGITPTSGGNRTKIEPANAVAAWAQNSGLSLKDIDPSANLLRNYKDFSGLISSLNSSLNAAEKSIKLGNTNPQLMQRYADLSSFKGILEYNKLLVDKIAKDRGYPLPKAIETVRSQLLDDGVRNEALLLWLMSQQKEKANAD